MTDDGIPLESGALSPEHIRLLLGALHLDITLVDEHRRVRYYNEEYRIFSRTPDCIGTDVVECHSPATRGRVAQLISELETGWRDEAEFLVEHDGRLAETRYVALRDGDGAYKGLLELVRYIDEPPAPRPSS